MRQKCPGLEAGIGLQARIWLQARIGLHAKEVRERNHLGELPCFQLAKFSG